MTTSRPTSTAPAVRFEHVSKSFSAARRRDFLMRRIARRSAPAEPSFRLEAVSFELAAGESLAVVGRNGAGKSTLLALLAGLAVPDAGRIRVSGRVAALMELGGGFHPDLTGRENLVLYAALLGSTRRQVERQASEIADFAGLGSHLLDPLRTYSSGMVLRLAFSVAIHVDPDVLVIDEVLAVGDPGFQARCIERIEDLRKAGKTLVLVSHDSRLLERLCDRALWLDRGGVRRTGPVDDVTRSYQEHVTSHSADLV
jgi:ABC-type polysaccharide/polyol phosphate transport system ATPase subunit